jgi:hypothetical protein
MLTRKEMAKMPPIKRPKIRLAKIPYLFLLKNADCFTSAMALYLYAQTLRGHDKDNIRRKVLTVFNLEEAALLLNMKKRTVNTAYCECLRKKWFVEVIKEMSWVEIIVKG